MSRKKPRTRGCCNCWYCLSGKTKRYTLLERSWRREDRAESWRDDLADERSTV